MVTIGLLTATPAGYADVFKCTAEDGSLTFQQTPCPEQKVEVIKTQKTTGSELDCRYASRFADFTARHMRAGVRSDEIFTGYGGLDAMSRPSIGVINYVYSFRTNNDVAVERIAGLAHAKCQAGSFGDASCKALPGPFTDGLGGCDGELQEEPAEPDGASLTAEMPDGGSLSSTHAQPIAAKRSTEDIVACKQHYRDTIDEIDAEMRRGYSSEQGEAYRQQLRQLTEKLRACQALE
jgi:uncharacterized protein DUF4124